MKIYIDSFTKMVAGVNTPAITFAIEIEVDDSFNITKTIEQFIGYEEVTEEGQDPVPITEKKIVNFNESPTLFNIQEVLEAKYKSILENSTCDYILAAMFLDENDIDISDKDHRANTGFALIELLPNGQAKTKPISLETTVSNFNLLEFISDQGIEIYLNDKKFIDGQVTLAEKVESCVIKFVNTTDTPKTVKSYAIGY